MIYVNQSKTNAYVKLGDVLEKERIPNIPEYYDDNDSEDYEQLANNIQERNMKYQPNKVKYVPKSKSKKLAKIGLDIINTDRKVMSTKKDKINLNFVNQFKRALVYNKETLPNYMECVCHIDKALNIKHERMNSLPIEFAKVNETVTTADNPTSYRKVRFKNEKNSNHNSRKSTTKKEQIVMEIKKDVLKSDDNNMSQLGQVNSIDDDNKNKVEGSVNLNGVGETGNVNVNLAAQNRRKIQETKIKRKKVLQNAIRYLMSNGITIQEYTKRNPFNSKPFALRNSEEFMEAVKFNNHDLVEQALKVNKKYLYEYDYYKQTAFHWAAKLGYVSMMKLLISNGKCVNQYDNKFRTPLFIAAMNNQEEIVRLLLANGGNPQIGDIEGRKPIDVTVSEIIKRDILRFIDKIYGDNSKKDLMM